MVASCQVPVNSYVNMIKIQQWLWLPCLPVYLAGSLLDCSQIPKLMGKTNYFTDFRMNKTKTGFPVDLLS